MNKYFITFLLTIMVIGQCFAQSSYRYDIIDVEQLRLKADSVAKINLEIEPDFYGYSAVLHTSNEGKLTTLTYPLDATFRYALPKGLGAEGAGIAVILDAHMQPSLQMGQFSVGKLPLKGKYADLGQAISTTLSGEHGMLSSPPPLPHPPQHAWLRPFRIEPRMLL